ncbi:MAG: bifunctional homocysteine S-methyltransferase/methylenetetrahydrofolate reductase [Gemmatimonadota bacterium]|nr:bifunctional homocysteine S-methyltransferase/methylenetetrahydrofolate reductase [Gemmatimonadota bacterium]
MSDLREMLAGERVHVMDGAMGTMLYTRGVFLNVCYDELNATHPELVEGVHEQYIRAGAEIIETNTFGANPVKLSSHGLDERTEELNARAAGLAVRTASGRAAVAGAIGPLGIRLEPLGPTSLEEARDYFGRQVDGLLAGGVDGFVMETFADLVELRQAFRAVRARCDLPVIAQVTVGEDGVTEYGTTAEQAARAADAWGADAVGLNCSVGPAVILEGLERMAEVTRLPLAAVPNAGLPRAIGDRKIYVTEPGYMAQYARRAIDAGARIVGGCCGTTPEHIRRVADVVGAIQPQRTSVRVIRSAGETAARKSPPPLASRSELGRLLARGEFVTMARILPPRGWDTTQMLDDCRALAQAGANAVGIHEDRRTARLSVLALAGLIGGSCPAEPLAHYTCRDRTLFGMISDLLGAAASGVRNVLLLTGDPPGAAPYPDYRSVVDVDSIGLTNVVTAMNRGVDPSGNDIGPPPGFVVGVALRQGTRNAARELGRFHWKVDAGAHFAVTQPVFDAEHLLEFLAGIEAGDGGGGSGIPVVAAIQPLGSLRHAEFLKNEVPGVVLPNRVVERMRRAEARGADHAAAEGIAIARETVAALTGEVAGVEVAAHRGPGVGAVVGVLEGVGGGDPVKQVQ